MANGGSELLFDLDGDPLETSSLCGLTGAGGASDVLTRLRAAGVAYLSGSPPGAAALDNGGRTGFREHAF